MLLKYRKITPKIEKNVFIVPGSYIIGDVKNKRCKQAGCNTRPHYNYEGETIGVYCQKHRLDGMMNVKDKNYYNT